MTDAEKVTLLREALRQITERKGAFSLDRLTHAENTIEAMAGIAEDALAATDNAIRVVEVDA